MTAVFAQIVDIASLEGVSQNCCVVRSWPSADVASFGTHQFFVT